MLLLVPTLFLFITASTFFSPLLPTTPGTTSFSALFSPLITHTAAAVLDRSGLAHILAVPDPPMRPDKCSSSKKYCMYPEEPSTPSSTSFTPPIISPCAAVIGWLPLIILVSPQVIVSVTPAPAVVVVAAVVAVTAV